MGLDGMKMQVSSGPLWLCMLSECTHTEVAVVAKLYKVPVVRVCHTKRHSRSLDI